MSYKNFGIAKQIVASKLSNSFLNESEFDRCKNLASKFADVIGDSRVLTAEFKLYESIEKKQINNDVLASKYIDNAIKVFENFSKEEIEAEHKKLNQFIDESFVNIPKEKRDLYNSLNILIEQISKKENVDVDVVHDAYTLVHEHLMNNSKIITEEENTYFVDDNIDMGLVVEKAIEKFNEKYSRLDEEEKNILKAIISRNDDKKKEIFESLKNENLELLNKVDKVGIEDKINETIDRIKSMDYNKEIVEESIIKLYGLKVDLI